MFIDQRADSKWRINIEGTALEPRWSRKPTKILEGCEKVGMYGYVLQPVGGSVDLG
jgi:hypothetical protein